MSKQQVRVQLDVDWIMSLEDKNAKEAVQWLEDYVPDGYILESSYNGYDDACRGVLASTREETDEEYEARIAKERALEAEKQYRKRLLEENQAEKMERYKIEDMALHNYLSKFPGNPHLNDLENLFRTTAQLEAQGKSGVILDNLKECIARLERGT